MLDVADVLNCVEVSDVAVIVVVEVPVSVLDVSVELSVYVMFRVQTK
jgi:hypothetical protein